MGSRDKHHAFSLKFYDQGMSFPATKETRQKPSITACPYHTAVLELRPQQHGSHSTAVSRQLLQSVSRQRLQYVPPVGLTQDWCIGTSASCGCTCASARGAESDDLACEIEIIIRASGVAATVNLSGQE
jgi:hypothetical protein